MTTLTIPRWTLGERLAKARTDAGLTTYELAEILGLSRNTVTNWETGSTTPKRYAIEAWAKACNNVDPEWIIGDNELEQTVLPFPKPHRAGRARTTSDQRKSKFRCTSDKAA